MTTIPRPIKPRAGYRAGATMWDEIDVDYFAGGGGVALGFEAGAGKAFDLAVNHDPSAIAMHAINHPETRHLIDDVWDVDISDEADGRDIRLFWASPDCKHFSRAKGGKPVEKKIRGLAWVAVRVAKAKRPRIIMLENVREFQDWGPLTADQRPCPARKGQTFRRFVAALRGLGYEVEWKVLNAADYGAPTHRRRLFLIARCDDLPIRWPDPTHGPGRIPWLTAAECIDWSLPCPSIFDRKRPLAEKTMRRIAMGLMRYVLENPKPFIVKINHGVDHFRGQEIDRPLSTVTNHHGHALISPSLVQTGYGEREGQAPRAIDIGKPLGTVVGGGAKHALVTAFLSQFFGGMVGKPLTDPVPTVTGKGPHEALAAAHITKLRGMNGWKPVDAPMDTVCAGATTYAATAACLARFNHGDKQWSGVDEPLGVVTAQGGKFGLVYAFLTKYFGTAVGQGADEPLHTVTGKHRFGVVLVEVSPGCVEPAVALEVPGVGPCVIADIGLRMLTPRELARAQGFPDAYVLTGSKANQVAKIGNSVPPPMVEALVRANL